MTFLTYAGGGAGVIFFVAGGLIFCKVVVK